MKAVNNPEFILIKKLQHLKEKYKDIPELAELEEETREIINQNCISSVQMAILYFLGCEKTIDPETEAKIRDILQSTLGRKA